MKSRDFKKYIRREIIAALSELKSPEEVVADKKSVEAAQASLKAAQEKLKNALATAAQKEGSIKLKSLLVKEAEEEPKKEEEPKEEEPKEEEPAEENPFATGEDEGEDKKEEEEGEGEGEDKKEEEEVTLNFNISKVKKYNPDKKFLGTQGTVKKVTKDGMLLTVIPDNVEIFVNFSDLE